MHRRRHYRALLATGAACAVQLAFLTQLQGCDGEVAIAPPRQTQSGRPDQFSSVVDPPAFLDPQLADIVGPERGKHPVADALRQQLARYDQQWGHLPRLLLDSSDSLTPGMSGPAVVQLRKRLGFNEGTSFDGDLTDAVRAFQAAHGIKASGVADRMTIAALNAGPQYYKQVLRLNLARAEGLPNPAGRSILVNVAAARLWMYDEGRVVGAMPVVVGRPAMQTPVLYGLIRYAVLNPYWNLPPDIVRDKVAPGVLREGADYIHARRYEILSDWSDAAQPITPDEVDWKSLQTGKFRLRVRQRPGAENMMGTIKFMSPNPLGIYLHDTPNRDVFDETDRRLSAGCIRVADAPGLAKWLFGKMPAGSMADKRVDLPEPVPVYIVYLTAFPESTGVQFTGDPYHRDIPAIRASIASRPGTATRLSGI